MKQETPDNRPLRILCPMMGVTLHLGGGRYDYEQMAALARAGHALRVLIPRRKQPETSTIPGVEFRWFRGRGFRHPFTWTLSFLLAVAAECSRWRPDVVRIHHPYYLGLLGILISRLLRIPCVFSVLHVEPQSVPGFAWVERRLFPRADGIFCISQWTTQQLRALTPHYRGVLDWAHCGIDPSFAPRPASTRVRLPECLRGFDPTTPTFLYVGSLIARKNLEWLIATFAEYHAQQNHGILVLAGDGELNCHLREQVARQGLADSVIFTGRVSEDEKRSLYWCATAVLFPSIMEGFGFVPAEAMACGTPAIVSDCGSLPEIVKHGETGFVLPVAGNSCAWVETMRQLVHDPQLRVRVGSNATSDVRMRFNWDRNAAAAADFMRRLVHLRGRTAS